MTRKLATTVGLILILIASAFVASQDQGGTSKNESGKESPAAGPAKGSSLPIIPGPIEVAPARPAGAPLDIAPAGASTQKPPKSAVPSTDDDAGQPKLQPSDVLVPPPSLAPPNSKSGREVSSVDVIVSWSASNDAIWGFSKPTGKWTRQAIDPPAKGRVRPIAAQGLAVLQSGTDFYAYSGQTGAWDVLRLPAGHTPNIEVSREMAVVHDGEDLYTFVPSTGRWSSPNGSAETTASEPEESQIKVFTLRHIQANDAQRIVEQLFTRDIRSVAADERSNSLIVRGPAEQLNIIYHILVRLDEQVDSDAKPPTARAAQEPDPAIAASVAERAGQYQAKERQAAEVARQLRGAQSGGSSDKAKLDKLSGDLRRAVTEAFAARQQLHQAEIAQLRQRIAGLEQTLKTRDQLSEQIIERRVKDLLQPNLQWDSAAQSGAPRETSTSTSSKATPSSPARPKVASSRGFGPEAEEIWKALGLEVRPLTPEEVPEPRYREALKIVDCDPTRSPGLWIGDLIVGLQVTGSRRPGMRKVEIFVRRDDETIPVVLEFPETSARDWASPPRASSSASSTPAAASAPAYQAVPAISGQTTTILRPAEEFADRLRKAQDDLDARKRGTLWGWPPRDPEEKAKVLVQQTSEAQRKLDFAREEYAAQIRLLELEVLDAESAVKAAQTKRQATVTAYERGAATRTALNEEERDTQAAQIRLDRAKTLLELYRKADPKNAATEARPADSAKQ
jgi:Bacterial type II/III secretion system short domain